MKINFEGVKICYKNFIGEVSEYNQKGKRLFHIILENQEHIDILEEEGVILRKKEKEDGEILTTVEVELNYVSGRNFVGIIETGRDVVEVEEDGLGILDMMPIEYADIECRFYRWTYLNKTGVRLYANDIYVKFVKNELREKYNIGSINNRVVESNNNDDTPILI